MTTLDTLLLVGFLVVVAFISIAASRGEHTRADYFLAGRSLRWWLSGFSLIATVLYSGATLLVGVLDLPALLAGHFELEPETAESLAFQVGVWGIGFSAGIYTVLGGLAAVVWSDLVQGAALLIGGAAVALLALAHLGAGEGLAAGWSRFHEANAGLLHVVRPWNDPEVPSLSLITGLWIPVMFYWGLNQFITQAPSRPARSPRVRRASSSPRRSSSSCR